MGMREDAAADPDANEGRCLGPWPACRVLQSACSGARLLTRLRGQRVAPGRRRPRRPGSSACRRPRAPPPARRVARHLRLRARRKPPPADRALPPRTRRCPAARSGGGVGQGRGRAAVRALVQIWRLHSRGHRAQQGAEGAIHRHRGDGSGPSHAAKGGAPPGAPPRGGRSLGMGGAAAGPVAWPP